ncbi:helix-turn-helix transcriptional regulator [Martelella soudanensis]|uniref:helix-turn-helix transcriptional regulator n=1 Tax=unclassified Martelella TaxID=2629616 RepID=UPI0015DE664E|nr:MULTISPECIES: LuxR C-terminal-related transcriptional regulator [unclassified Martelella]
MLRPLSEDVSRIAFARNLPELKTAFTLGLNRLGFISYNISVNRSSPSEFMEKPTLTTWTTKELDTYVNDKWSGRDPLMMHLELNKTPLLWHQKNWDTSDHQEYYDYVRFQGITGGLTLPLPALDGKSSAITLLSIDKIPQCPHVIDAVTILSSVAVARMAAFKEGQFSEYDIRRFKLLSDLQVEILNWMAKGKTNNEISSIVGRSERAIAYHVSEILAKLDVTSRAQAAAFYAAMGFSD